jgi:hypothetical protein
VILLRTEIATGVEMARIGDEIEHPLTGERMTFLETARSRLDLKRH